MCNMDLSEAGVERNNQLNELEELRLQAYETSKTYKERTNKWHDNRLKDKKEFQTGDCVFSTWIAFGEVTCDLGSFGEETDYTTDLHQILEELVHTECGDGVASIKRHLDHIQADAATKDASRLHFFHFTLKGKAKEWLDKIPPGTITSWEQIVSKFLNKFFPPERTARIRDKILRFHQSNNESIKDAWKRFQYLLHQAPHHGIKKWLLV
ncbi:zinc finger, CCHC-type containing protein [Tanacetum coccineum]